jgi:hypothetical protein
MVAVGMAVSLESTHVDKDHVEGGAIGAWKLDGFLSIEDFLPDLVSHAEKLMLGCLLGPRGINEAGVAGQECGGGRDSRAQCVRDRGRLHVIAFTHAHEFY